VRDAGRGFTVIEFMMVLAVIAVMTAMALPYFRSYLAASRVDGAARQVLSDLVAARMKAVTLNRTVKVAFSGDHEYRMDATGTPEIRDIRADYGDVTLSATGDPQFHAGGTAVGARITLSGSGGSKRVSVASTGRVKID